MDIHPKVANMTLTSAIAVLISVLWNATYPNHQIDSTVALAAATVIVFIVGYLTPGKVNNG